MTRLRAARRAMTRLLAGVACLAAAVTLALPAVQSDARFNTRSANPGDRVLADHPVNYLRLYSQSSDPSGLTGYAVKLGTIPPTPAATGADETLTVALGGLRNVAALPATRVLTLQAGNPLPAGASPLTVRATLTADPATGRQPLSQVTFSNTNGTGAAATATLTAGAKRQLNLSVTTRGFPGNNRLYRPSITLTITHPGYAGTFLNYVVPVTVWDGAGAGP